MQYKVFAKFGFKGDSLIYVFHKIGFHLPKFFAMNIRSLLSLLILGRLRNAKSRMITQCH